MTWTKVILHHYWISNPNTKKKKQFFIQVNGGKVIEFENKKHTSLWVYLHKSSVKYSFFHLCTTHDNIREISSHMLKSPTSDGEKETSHWSIFSYEFVVVPAALKPSLISWLLTDSRVLHHASVQACCNTATLIFQVVYWGRKWACRAVHPWRQFTEEWVNVFVRTYVEIHNSISIKKLTMVSVHFAAQVTCSLRWILTTASNSMANNE